MTQPALQVTEEDARQALANLTKLHDHVVKHNRKLQGELAVAHCEIEELRLFGDSSDDPAWNRRFRELQSAYWASKA